MVTGMGATLSENAARNRDLSIDGEVWSGPGGQDRLVLPADARRRSPGQGVVDGRIGLATPQGRQDIGREPMRRHRQPLAVVASGFAEQDQGNAGGQNERHSQATR